MAVTLEELFKASPRREIRSSKGNLKNKKVIRNKTLLENIVKNGDISSRISENGTLKMKILVKKQDLKQMLETVDVVSNNNNNCTSTCTSISISTSTSESASVLSLSSSKLLLSSFSSIERRMNDLVKRRRASQVHQGQQQPRAWRPALQSIPEEISLIKV
ncbi:hypothetical protein RND81_11G148400 [Saponaria officinalis]|uniref:Uncharacterized protein n=1 Tax=Saponaria officinalis TaxID=3572 RepID=A0AAW1HMB8_SAPOF